MPQPINIPGKGTVNFPDSFSDEQIVKAVEGLTGGEQEGLSSGQAVSFDEYGLPEPDKLQPPTEQYKSRGKAGHESSIEMLRAAASGLVAGALHLGNLPFQASEGLVELASGKSIDGAGDKQAAAIDYLEKLIAGDLGDNQAARVVQTIAEFGSVGGAIRKGVKQVLPKDVVPVMNRPVISDIAAGGATQVAAEAGQGPAVQLAAGLTAGGVAQLGRPSHPLMPKNVEETQVIESLRARPSGIATAEKAMVEETKIGANSTLAELSQNPNLQGSINALRKQSSDIDAIFGANEERFTTTVAEYMTGLRHGANLSQAPKIYRERVNNLKAVIHDIIGVQERLVSSGKIKQSEASEAVYAHLSKLEAAATKEAGKLYDNVDYSKVGRVPAKEILEATKKETSVHTVEKSRKIILGKEVRDAEALILNELDRTRAGSKPGIGSSSERSIIRQNELALSGKSPVKIANELRLSGKGTLEPAAPTIGRKTQGIQSTISDNTMRLSGKGTIDSFKPQALKDIRSDILASSRNLKSEAGGSTADTNRLDAMARAITAELEKIPQLAEANLAWRTMKESFHDGQLATFFAKRATGIEKTAPERMFNMFIKGTSKKANKEQVERVFAEYDKTGAMKKAFDEDLRGAFVTSLRAEAGLKGSLTHNQWAGWLKRNGEALHEYGLFNEFSKFSKSATEAHNLKITLKELEASAFADIAGGNIENVVDRALRNGTVRELARSMPTKMLNLAVKKTAAAKIIDLEHGLINPTKMLQAIGNNKRALLTAIGKEGVNTLTAMANTLKRHQLKGGSPLAEQRKAIVPDSQTAKTVINLATAVIGSIRRRAFKVGQALQQGEARKTSSEAFIHAMLDPAAKTRLLRIAKTHPKEFRDMWLLAAVPPLTEAAQEK